MEVYCIGFDETVANWSGEIKKLNNFKILNIKDLTIKTLYDADVILINLAFLTKHLNVNKIPDGIIIGKLKSDIECAFIAGIPVFCFGFPSVYKTEQRGLGYQTYKINFLPDYSIHFLEQGNGAGEKVEYAEGNEIFKELYKILKPQNFFITAEQTNLEYRSIIYDRVKKGIAYEIKPRNSKLYLFPAISDKYDQPNDLFVLRFFYNNIDKILMEPIGEPIWLDKYKTKNHDTLIKKKEELFSKIKQYQEFMKLLYLRDKGLEIVVKLFLEYLGLTVDYAKEGQHHDLETKWKGEDIWIEVTGSKNAIDYDKISKFLGEYLTAKKERSNLKGAVIANPFNNLDLQDRKSKKPIQDDALKNLKVNNISFVSTVELYNHIEDIEKDDNKKVDICNNLFSSEKE